MSLDWDCEACLDSFEHLRDLNAHRKTCPVIQRRELRRAQARAVDEASYEVRTAAKAWRRSPGRGVARLRAAVDRLNAAEKAVGGE